MPERLRLNSLSAYHCGQGGGATDFDSLEYVSVPAKAADPRATSAHKLRASFFICFLLFWLSLGPTITPSGHIFQERCWGLLWMCAIVPWAKNNCKGVSTIVSPGVTASTPRPYWNR